MGPSAPPPVPPWEAAQQLRMIVKKVRGVLPYLKAGGGNGHKITEFTNSHYRTEELGIRLRAQEKFQRLRTAIETRRVGEGRTALDELQSFINSERIYGDRAWRVLPDTFGDASRINVVGPAGANTTYYTKIETMLNEINNLVQSLPTQEKLPSSSQDMIIRGIVAILRTHDVPGINGVDPNGHEAKEKTHGKEKAAAAASGEAIAASLIPAAPATNESGTIQFFPTTTVSASGAPAFTAPGGIVFTNPSLETDGPSADSPAPF